jgi:hypothetical protein
MSIRSNFIQFPQMVIHLIITNQEKNITSFCKLNYLSNLKQNSENTTEVQPLHP